MFKNVILAWKKELKSSKFKVLAITAPLSVVISMIIFTRFLNFIELRPGIVMFDPILAMFNPIDISWFTFFLMYGSLIVGLSSLLPYPKTFVLALLSYTVMLWIRMPAMYTMPFEAPATILPLIDPMVSEVGVGTLMTKDLFFSGHTATVFLLYLNSQTKLWKNVFLTLTILVGFCVLLQHVHYTVDVIAAPFFGYGAFVIARRFVKRVY
jgi:hypothetical protein